jgi:tetratricopeptide (TPR) repeat protein
MARRHGLSAVLTGLILVVAGHAAAADTWLQVKSENFTVMTNAGERKARNVAWQFEQIRAAIRKGWPWARATLDRPVFVIAVKDENSMRALAPQYWEERGRVHPVSIFVSTADRHYITLRADVEEQEQGMNPYITAFKAYSTLVLEASFNRGLPLWLTNGMAAVLSNTIILDKEVQFGKPIPWLAELAQNGPRLSLAALVAVTRESPSYRQQKARERFDAQCWSLVQFMMFGAKEDMGARLNPVSRMLMDGVASEAALREVYGSLDALDDASSLYVHQGVYTYARLQVQSDTSAAKLPGRPVPPAESAAARAGFHVAMGRLVEAEALLSEARNLDPSLAMSDEVAAMMFDRDQKADEAKQAFAKAAAADSKNFWVYYRLAALGWLPGIDRATMSTVLNHLERSTALNQNFGPGFSNLANMRLQLDQPDQALVAARRAVELDPGNVEYRLLFARVLARLSRREEAAAVARDALSYATNERQRSEVQALLSSLDRIRKP